MLSKQCSVNQLEKVGLHRTLLLPLMIAVQPLSGHSSYVWPQKLDCGHNAKI